ncbi:hypothetical protein HKX48_006610 [Thoreauomyces humboldtii]|nr:hypothetical protein HKX48_006610 [Thoreauomyces humboldtii]
MAAQPILGHNQLQGSYASDGMNSNDADRGLNNLDADGEDEIDEDEDNTDEEVDDLGGTGHKRKRIVRACDACGKKKIKCDGAKPHCANCLRSSTLCTYARHTKKRGPREGYIMSLENRLKEMEALLKPHGGSDPSAHQRMESGDVIDPAVPAGISYDGAVLGNLIPPGHASSGNLQMATNPTSRPEVSAPSAQAMPYVFGPSMNMSTLNSALPPLQNAQRNPGFIPPEALNELIGLFFHYLTPVLRLIHQPTFYANIASQSPLLLNSMYALAARFSSHPAIQTEVCYNAGDMFYIKAREMVDHYMDVPNASTVTALLILANYAAESGRGSAAWMYSGMAIRMAQELKLNVEPDFDETLSSIGSNLTWLEKESRRRLWWNCFVLDRYAGAAADRSMIINEKDCRVYLPAEEAEWEQGTGTTSLSTHGGSATPTNDSYQIAVLTSTQTFTPGMASQSPYGYFILLVKIFGKILEYSNTLKNTQRVNGATNPALTPDADYQLSVLDASLRDWFSSLPDWMRDLEADHAATQAAGGPQGPSGPNPPSFGTAFVHIFYHTCVILLHRPKMMLGAHSRDAQAGTPPSGNTASAEILQNASFIVCLSSANAIATVIRQVLETNPNFLYLPPFVGFCIFQSGLVHLLASQLTPGHPIGQHSATSPDPAHRQFATVVTQAQHNVSAHLTALKGVSRFWFMPSRLHAMLTSLVNAGPRADGSVARAITGANISISDNSWVALKGRQGSQQQQGQRQQPNSPVDPAGGAESASHSRTSGSGPVAPAMGLYGVAQHQQPHELQQQQQQHLIQQQRQHQRMQQQQQQQQQQQHLRQQQQQQDFPTQENFAFNFFQQQPQQQQQPWGPQFPAPGIPQQQPGDGNFGGYDANALLQQQQQQQQQQQHRNGGNGGPPTDRTSW